MGSSNQIGSGMARMSPFLAQVRSLVMIGRLEVVRETLNLVIVRTGNSPGGTSMTHTQKNEKIGKDIVGVVEVG